MRFLWLILLLLGPSAQASQAQRLVSINPCFDNWLPQWVGQPWHIVPSTAHGDRLEQIIALRPTRVLAGSFVGRQLRLALTERTAVSTLPYVTHWQQWREAVNTLGQTLGQAPQARRWLLSQEQQMAQLELQGLGETLVLMPNGYTWGEQSWVHQLLTQQSVRLSPLAGSQELVRLNLEQVLQSQPDTVILEGFSTRYARAHDWLWHDGLQGWLTDRRVIEINAKLAGCSTVRALDYLQQLQSHLAREHGNAAP